MGVNSLLYVEEELELFDLIILGILKVEDVETQFQPSWIVVKRTNPIFTERVPSCIIHGPHIFLGLF